MFRALKMNVLEFMFQKKSFFIMFMFTLITVSFSGLYVLNWLSQELLSGLSAHYYVEFCEPVKIGELDSLLKKSGLKPSSSYYFDEQAASILSFSTRMTSSGSSVKIQTDFLDKNESPGVYSSSFSKYSHNDYRLFKMLYGRHLESKDNGKNNAVASHYLDSYIDSNKISIGNVEYDVVGCYQNPPPFSVSSILVSPETFENNGYSVWKAYLIFELVPSHENMISFEKQLGVKLLKSNMNDIRYFTFGSVLQLIKNCAIFVVMFIFVFASISGIYYCWSNSTGRLYSIYKLCGISNLKTRVLIFLEMLLYTSVTNIIGVLLFYLLLITDVLQYVSYPYAIFVPINYLTMLFFSFMVAFRTEKKASKKAFVYNI